MPLGARLARANPAPLRLGLVAMGGSGDDGSAVVLSYGDALLRRRDADTVAPGAWLNDAVLELALARLAGARDHSEHGGVVLLPPSLAQLGAALGADAGALLPPGWYVRRSRARASASAPHAAPRPAPCELSLTVARARSASAALILAPVSDSDAYAAAESGSHWTLLAYSRGARLGCSRERGGAHGVRWAHYDSLRCSSRSRNAERAVALAAAIAAAAGAQPPREDDVVEGMCPRQANASDCGAHVLATAEALLTALDAGASAEAIDDAEGRALDMALHTASSPAAAAGVRARLAADIASLAAEQGRSANRER